MLFWSLPEILVRAWIDLWLQAVTPLQEEAPQRAKRHGAKRRVVTGWREDELARF